MKKNNTIPPNNHCGYPEYPIKENIWKNGEIIREQIRGTFVMGFMAFIFSIIVIFPNSDYLKYFSYPLFVFWGYYLFLITMSTSDDIILDEGLLYML